MSVTISLNSGSPKEYTPNYILNLTKAILVDPAVLSGGYATVTVKGSKDQYIMCHLSQQHLEFSLNLSFAPHEVVTFEVKTSKQVKKDTPLITLVGVDTQLVPAPNHLSHWALPSDESDDEDSDHDNDWRLDLAEAGSQESDDDMPEDVSDEESDEAPAAPVKSSPAADAKNANKKRKREEEAPAPAAKPAAAAKSTQVPDAKKPKKAVQKIPLLKPTTRKHPMGVTITERVMSDGPVVKYGKVATIKYSCTLPNGQKIDEGERSFRFGVGEVLRGWDYGLEGMRVGSERIIIVPQVLAYSTQSTVPIPEAAKKAQSVQFDIELVDLM